VLAGWAYWQFKIFKDLTTTAGTGAEGFYNLDGSLQEKKVKALSRTYAQNTQGTLKKQFFNTSTSHFEIEFVYDHSIKAPTVVYGIKNYEAPTFELYDIEAGEIIQDASWKETDYSLEVMLGGSAEIYDGRSLRLQI